MRKTAETKERYKVYRMDAEGEARGSALIAANSAEEANKFIRVFINSDTNNECYSKSYTFVSEKDCIDGLHSDITGIIADNIC
jgi:hypothetical protein